MYAGLFYAQIYVHFLIKPNPMISYEKPYKALKWLVFSKVVNQRKMKYNGKVENKGLEPLTLSLQS